MGKRDRYTDIFTDMISNPNNTKQSSDETGLKINKESYAIDGYLIKGIMYRRQPDKDLILDNAVEYLKNLSALVDKIKNDRRLMKNDGGIIMALCILRDIASGPKSVNSRSVCQSYANSN